MLRLLPLLAALLAGVASAAARLEAADPATYQGSLAAVRAELAGEARARFEVALVQVAHERAAFDHGPPRETPLDPKRVHGLTAAEVITLAERVATVPAYQGGERPGLPERFRRTLADTVAVEGGVGQAPRLGGSLWEVVSVATNGAVAVERLELRTDGTLRRLPDGSIAGDRWTQQGRRVRLSFNDGYAVMLGGMLSGDALFGEAANAFGDAGVRWTAQRIDPRAPLRIVADSAPHADAWLQLMAAFDPATAAAATAAAVRLSGGCDAPDPRTRAPIGPDFRRLAGLTAAELAARGASRRGCAAAQAP